MGLEKNVNEAENNGEDIYLQLYGNILELIKELTEGFIFTKTTKRKRIDF